MRIMNDKQLLSHAVDADYRQAKKLAEEQCGEEFESLMERSRLFAKDKDFVAAGICEKAAYRLRRWKETEALYGVVAARLGMERKFGNYYDWFPKNGGVS